MTSNVFEKLLVNSRSRAIHFADSPLLWLCEKSTRREFVFYYLQHFEPPRNIRKSQSVQSLPTFWFRSKRLSVSEEAEASGQIQRAELEALQTSSRGGQKKQGAIRSHQEPQQWHGRKLKIVGALRPRRPQIFSTNASLPGGIRAYSQ